MSEPQPQPQSPTKKDKSFLESLLNKTLRVTTRDTRMFVGQLKCTDKDKNLILSLTHEYRMPDFTSHPSSEEPKSEIAEKQLPPLPSCATTSPSPEAEEKRNEDKTVQGDNGEDAMAPTPASLPETRSNTKQINEGLLRKGQLEAIAKMGGKLSEDGKKVMIDLQRRFVGLVVVPGEEIVKIEVEEMIVA